MGTVTIIKRPFITIDTGSPAFAGSRWNAVWVPVNYRFQFESITDRIVIRVYEYASNTLLSVSTHAPRPDLIMNFDISEYIRNYLYSELQTLTNEVNKTDPGNVLKCYLTYQVYDFNEDPDSLSPRPVYSEEANFICVTCSAKQYGDLYGGNMGEYVPYGVDVPENRKAKFLTAFERPVKFVGFPFSLSFIYSEVVANHEINRTEQELDVNGNNVGAEIVTGLDLTQGGQINYLQTSSNNPGVKFVDLSLTIGQSVPQTYVETGYVETGYTEIL